MHSPIAVRLHSDPAGTIEVPAVPRCFIAVHVGRSVTMTCERGGQSHKGIYVHGDIDIVPAHTTSKWSPEQPDTALIVSLDSSLLDTAAAEANIQSEELEIRNRFQIRDPQIEHICWALKAEMEAGYPTGQAFIDGLAASLASALVCRHRCDTPISSAAEGRLGPLPGFTLRRVLSFIEDNLSNNLPLTKLADLSGMSTSHFKQMFRRTTGAPVHRYVIQRRVQRAQSLLLSTRLSISEVALAAGFAHQSHLALHMRRLIGVSPRVLRAGMSRSAEAKPILSDTLSL